MISYKKEAFTTALLKRWRVVHRRNWGGFQVEVGRVIESGKDVRLSTPAFMSFQARQALSTGEYILASGRGDISGSGRMFPECFLSFQMRSALRFTRNALALLLMREWKRSRQRMPE